MPHPLYRLFLLTPLLLLEAHADIRISNTSDEVADVLKGYIEPQFRDCAEVPPDPSQVDRVIRKGLDALGFYFATHELVFGEDACFLEVSMNLGERSQIAGSELHIVDEENLAADDSGIEQSLSFSGEFDPQAYERAKQQALKTLKDRGYFDATFDGASVVIDPASKAAQIGLHLRVGPRYLIRNLQIEQSTLAPDYFARYLELVPGTALRTQDLLSTYENLLTSDYFSRVTITPDLDRRSDGAVDIDITAAPVDPWSILAGVGFATDSGPRVRAQANARYLNERGHRFNSSALFAPVLGHVKSEYRWPYGDPRHQWFALEARVNYEDTDSAESESASLALRRMTRLGKHWTQTTYAEYLTENFDVATQDGRSQALLVGGNLTFTSAISSRRPRAGRSVTLDVRGSHSSLLSDIDLFQVRMHARQILPFVATSRLLLRAELGATWHSSFSELPASLRFFAGGDKSVRGYAFEELGPEDERGNVIGGDRLLTGSVEWDVPVNEAWSVALFADAGSAFDDKPDFSRSVGIGARWYSPLGPVRLDLAHPLDEAGQEVRIHISLGPDI